MNVNINKKYNRYYSLIIIIICTIGVMGALGFARFGYTMILPEMKKGLELDDSQAGDLATGNMIGYLLLAITCGFLSSRFSPRLIITVFMFVISGSMFLTGLAPDFMVAMVGRILTGIGSGGTNVPIMGLVSAWFVSKRRGLAAGIAVSGSSFGLLLTGLIIPRIHEYYITGGWRFSWFYLGGLVFVIAIICMIFLRNRPDDKGISVIGTKGIIENKNTEDQESLKNKSVSSIKWSLVYKTPSIWNLAIIYILFGFSYIIYATFFSRYLIWEAGFLEQEAGALWATLGAVSIISGFIWGSISDILGRKYGLALVFFLQSLCYLIFGLCKSMPGYYISAGLFALTAWSIPAIMAAAAGDIVGSRLAPAALGFITLFLGIGQALGPFIAGRIAVLNNSYTIAFIIAGLAALLGAIASLLLKIKKDT